MSMLHVPGRYQVAFSTDVKNNINIRNGKEKREKKRADNRNANRLKRRINNEWNEDTPEFKKQMRELQWTLEWRCDWYYKMLGCTSYSNAGETESIRTHIVINRYDFGERLTKQLNQIKALCLMMQHCVEKENLRQPGLPAQFADEHKKIRQQRWRNLGDLIDQVFDQSERKNLPGDIDLQ